jgi:hypothetical protein
MVIRREGSHWSECCIPASSWWSGSAGTPRQGIKTLAPANTTRNHGLSLPPYLIFYTDLLGRPWTVVVTCQYMNPYKNSVFLQLFPTSLWDSATRNVKACYGGSIMCETSTFDKKNPFIICYCLLTFQLVLEIDDSSKSGRANIATALATSTPQIFWTSQVGLLRIQQLALPGILTFFRSWIPLACYRTKYLVTSREGIWCTWTPVFPSILEILKF